MNIYRETGMKNSFIISKECPGNGFEYISYVGDDVSLIPVIPDFIFNIISDYDHELLSTGFEIRLLTDT